MRYKAPDHTHSIDLSTGTLTVGKEGFVEVSGELSLGDITGLIANGFTPEEAQLEAAAAPSGGKGKPAANTGSENG